MQDLDGSSWKRRGCSIVWSPVLLGPLITEGDAVPLRTVLGWFKFGFPESPPGDRSTVLVGGLQTVLNTLPDPACRYDWLRRHVLPLNRACADHWGNVGLVFCMDGPASMFTFNNADDLVYFGKGTDLAKKIPITRALWNGAATGTGVYRLTVPGTNEAGGYHVQRIS